jgi:DNA-binding response OmpR family regulator
MATTKYLLPAVLKYIEEFKSQRPLPEKISFKGLILDTQAHYLLFKNCKIQMHPMWIVILHFLIKQESCCDIAKIQKYLEMIFERSISQSCISANIHRLNKRVKHVTGLEIIRNRYGVGYYLVL